MTIYMLMKELFHDILINSQNAYGLKTDIVSEWLVQRKMSNYKVKANWNKVGNIGKHNQSHLIFVIHLSSNSPLCNDSHECFLLSRQLKSKFFESLLTHGYFSIFTFLHLFSPCSFDFFLTYVGTLWPPFPTFTVRKQVRKLWKWQNTFV